MLPILLVPIFSASLVLTPIVAPAVVPVVALTALVVGATASSPAIAAGMVAVGLGAAMSADEVLAARAAISASVYDVADAPELKDNKSYNPSQISPINSGVEHYDPMSNVPNHQ